MLSTIIPPIAIVGAGRVGSALGLALHAVGLPIAAVASRTSAHAAELAARVDAPHVGLFQAVRAPFVLFAVPDDAITTLAELVADAQGWRAGQTVVHVSGALPAGALAVAQAQGALIGAWHPLAAFARRNQPLPPGLTFAVEAAAPLHDTLHALTALLGGTPLDLAPAVKPLYHAAAVLVSNYSVVLTALAVQLLAHTATGPDQALAALLPLLATTLDNLRSQGLPAGLTGPLVRGDVGTVKQHMAALEQHEPQIAEVYRVLGTAALPLIAARHDAATLTALHSALAAPSVVEG